MIFLPVLIFRFQFFFFFAVVRDKLAADPLLEEYTCIPIDNLMEMLTFCVETTYFGMGSDIYRQEKGLAMGSPLSPVLVNST